jgi:hypothetical protein
MDGRIRPTGFEARELVSGPSPGRLGRAFQYNICPIRKLVDYCPLLTVALAVIILINLVVCIARPEFR